MTNTNNGGISYRLQDFIMYRGWKSSF